MFLDEVRGRAGARAAAVAVAATTAACATAAGPFAAVGPLAAVGPAVGAGVALAAQETALVSNMDPAYDDLAVLAALGLVLTTSAGEGPHSRAAFARWTAEARDRAEAPGAPPPSARVQEILERFRRRFGGERSAVALRSARLDVWAARSPSRLIGPGAANEIDGVLNPLLQSNQGRQVADGWTAAAEFSGDLSAGPFALGFRPRAWTEQPRGAEPAKARSTFVDTYARVVGGAFALEAGRLSVSLGRGQHGGPLLSHNARGLDLARLASDRPFRLPGFLRGMGEWRASAMVANMGGSRDVPDSWLAGFRVSNRVWSKMQLALFYLNLQGGDGSPEGSFWKRAADLLLPFRGGVVQVSDKVGGGDLQIAVPSVRALFYLNFVATDLRRNFNQFLRAYWQDAVWSGGVRTLGLGAQGRFDAWLEAKSAGPLVHTHSQFTSGLTLDGRVIGDPLGPNARSVAAGVSWTAPLWRLSATAARERYSGDEWRLVGAFEGDPRPWEWTKIKARPAETRTRLTVDWTNRPAPGNVFVSARLAYEQAGNFNFAGGRRHNFLVRISAGWAGG